MTWLDNYSQIKS